MPTFVLVPGAWHGSWCFEAVVPFLERAGHTVHALTLIGLRPRDDNATVATTNLDTHADDVLALLDRAHITGATLIGHSYGGPTGAVGGSCDHHPVMASRAGRRRLSSIGRRSSMVPLLPATPSTLRTAAMPDGALIHSRRCCKRSGSPARRLRSLGASSFTAPAGATRPSLNSAPDFKPIRRGKCTTSRPPTTRCARPRMPSLHFCSMSASQTNRHEDDRIPNDAGT
jgi:hypothetical protein